MPDKKNKPLTGLIAKLQRMQRGLNSPKGQRNAFGKYNYRSCEDILEAVKPLLAREACAIIISDEITEMAGRVYIKSTVRLLDADGDDPIRVSAFAREPLSRKGMDESQITGSSSSYARKYALNGLFCIDDCKDADTMDNRASAQAVIDKPTLPPPVIDIDHDATTGAPFDDGEYEAGAVYEAVKKGLNEYRTKTGYKAKNIGIWIKGQYDGRTLADMKNDDGLLLRVLKAVQNEYPPSIGDSVEGAIPGKVVRND